MLTVLSLDRLLLKSIDNYLHDGEILNFAVDAVYRLATNIATSLVLDAASFFVRL